VANLDSSKKRIRQNEKNRIRNRARKSLIKTATRQLLDAIHDGDMQTAKSLLSKASKQIDQVAAKGTIHRNTASRKKSRLTKRLNKAAAAKA